MGMYEVNNAFLSQTEMVHDGRYLLLYFTLGINEFLRL
ncbi:hypothetical protein JCM19240_3374 [Vibrio maritimus]|uniref:Uncharacterized protein n=1 Tax=Vibrio maritimus TaxID=990268 RepID=A0A090T8F1_9VIBR|nr:hypothetical protein JCM19240_3374 [Vibrio maritimus]